jgi:hypothetical protein
MVGTLPDWFRLKSPPPALEAIFAGRDMVAVVGAPTGLRAYNATAVRCAVSTGAGSGRGCAGERGDAELERAKGVGRSLEVN